MSGHTRATAAFAAGLLLALNPAFSQQVQRCETPEGKVTYSNVPCPDGTQPVRKIESDPAPSAAEQKAARERAQQHSRELDKLERQRQKDEEKAARERAAADSKQAKHDAECRKLDARVKVARDEFDNATLDQRQRADRKLRLAEDQAAACKKL